MSAARPSICLCIAGQMRSFENNDLSWLDALRARAEVTVVVSTWRSRGSKVSGPMDAQRLDLLLPPGLTDLLPAPWQCQDLFSDLPPLRRRMAELGRSAEISAEMVRATWNPARLHLEDDFGFGFFENRATFGPGIPRGLDPFTLRQFYKVFQANVMKRSLEAERGAPFDLVVRTRPDMQLTLAAIEAMLPPEPGRIFVDDLGGDYVGDQLAAGDSRTTDIDAGFFAQAWELITAGRWRNVHTDLKAWLDRHGLRIAVPRGVHGILANPTVTVADLEAALREVPAADPGPLPLRAAVTLDTLAAEAMRLGGDPAGAAARALTLLRAAPEDAGRNGILSVLLRALRDRGEHTAGFAAAALAMAEEAPARDLFWRGPQSRSQAWATVVELAPGHWSFGAPLPEALRAVLDDLPGELGTTLGAALTPAAAERLAQAGERAMRAAERNLPLLRHLGQLYEAADQPAEAARCFERILALHPADPWALEHLGATRSDAAG